MKKMIAAILAASVCLGAAACSTPPETTTTQEQTPVVTTTQSSADEQVTTTTAAIVGVTTTTEQTAPETPDEWTVSDDIEALEIGKYITLHYNGASADVKYTVEKGVGSRENVTITLKLHDGYLFDGWSEGDAIVNGKSAKSKELTYTVNATRETKLYLNTSMQVVYHENGGQIAKSGFDGTDTFSAVFHHNPNTLPEKGYFSREGYTLTSYNTKADGTGESVSLGSKVTGGKGVIDVYCIWEKNTAESAFETSNVNGGVAIQSYTGNDENVVIPSVIGGKKVVKIASSAFRGNTSVKRVVIPSTVHTVEGKVFENCLSMETVVLFDTVKKLDDTAFTTCKTLKNVRINTVYELTNDWLSCGAAKIDRLMWAKDKKKIVIIGGSGSLYGFDCSYIDEALNGEYEIINFGENANVSSIVYFDMVEDFVGEGDIVLWCPEPGVYTLGYQACSNRFWEFRKSDYDFTKYINPQYYTNFYSSFASYSSGLSSKSFKSYDALSSSMDKYGSDLSDHTWNGSKFNYNFDYDMLGKTEITELVKNITDKGANVFYSFAAMQESGMESVREQDVERLESLITSVPGIVSISDYQNCIYPDDYFWDSAWHLCPKGMEARAQRVAEDLLVALGKK